jgi:agmatinase
MLGGEHSLSAGAVRGAIGHYPDLTVIQLDAHADLRPDYLGEKFSHACAMRRCLDILGDPLETARSTRLLQVGIRSGTRDEFAELEQSGRYVAPEPAALLERIADFGARPVYLTVDLDVFDPAYFPGTGTPEPGGIDWPRFEQFVNILSALNIIGCDVMELAPQLDTTGISSVLAAKVVRELLLLMGPAR